VENPGDFAIAAPFHKAPSAREYARVLAQLTESGQPFAVATVIGVDGSASARPGSKAILDARGRTLFGWVGGGCAESAVRDEALAALRDGRTRRLRLDLDDEVLGVGMPCGGYMDLFIEPVIPQPKLVVLGHGAIAETAARLGALLGFHVTANDPLASPERFPDADACIVDDPDYAKVECDGDTYVVITTQHKSDFEALSAVLRRPPAYVGVVASRKRSALLIERLFQAGFEPELLRRVAAPCGLDLGAATPQEIALSIVAEIQAQRRGGNGRPLVETKGPRIGPDGVEVPDGPEHGGSCPR
jgi:xanthine dehydrogenase accessory factor